MKNLTTNIFLSSCFSFPRCIAPTHVYRKTFLLIKIKFSIDFHRLAHMDLYTKAQRLCSGGGTATICNCTTAATTNAKSSGNGSSNAAKTAKWVRNWRDFEWKFFIDFSCSFVFCRPPVISGSHTLQHPNKNKHHPETMNMIPPHHHPNPNQNQMRQMGLGTQTLGRHHHSPNHMRQNSGEIIFIFIWVIKLSAFASEFLIANGTWTLQNFMIIHNNVIINHFWQDLSV